MSNLPRVLVVGINAWRKDATAHTLMSIFSCWDPQRLALVYTRSDYPDTDVCSRFFQISENKVLKSVFNPTIKTGMEVFNTPVVDDALVAEEHARYEKAHKKHSYLMTICRECVWMLGHWRTKELRGFVDSFKPDIIFVPIYNSIYMAWVQRYIMKLTRKPIACYLADDNYSYESCKGVLSYIHRFFLRRQVKYLATKSNKMFVIVDKEKEDTDNLFGTDSRILTKGIDFSNRTFVKKTVKKPIRFVYTGNLLIGRSKTIALLSDIMNQVDKGRSILQLDIYAPDEVDSGLLKKMNSGCSSFKGFIPRNQVDAVQKEADVVVFAEALEGKDANAARLSFSTKITDYLANGKCILAIGKKEIAPIDYFVKNDSAIVATDEIELREVVERIVADYQLIEDYQEKAFECAKRNHDVLKINKMFIEEMMSLVSSDN